MCPVSLQPYAGTVNRMTNKRANAVSRKMGFMVLSSVGYDRNQKNISKTTW